MFKRIPVFAFILLLSFLLYSRDAGSVHSFGNPVVASTGIDRAALITFAKQYLGTPYRRASADPKRGFDCSGLVNFVFREFKVTLPRSSREFKAFGAPLKPEEFKVGDVVVFYGFRDRSHIGHVGIICEANGMKSRFIHASSGKARRVIISELDSKGYSGRFYKCIDVIR